MKALLLALAAAWSGTAAAHEVHHTVTAAGAIVVSLSYADGSAFAYEKYELTPDGQQVPAQVGNTDAAGRVVFLPDNRPRWRLRAYSADGHGVDLRFEAPQPAATTPAAPAAGPDRATQVVLGLSILFGLLGLLQLFLHRRQS